MANYAKFTKGAMGHMLRHYERAKDENGEYIKFGNQDIDPSRTHLNYNLAPEHNQLQFIHDRLDEVYCMKRKDVNVISTWVVTAPKDLDPNREDDFFKAAYAFLEKKYGKENVVSAYVHKDEKSAHMHFCFMPVVADQKRGFKVSAKECVTLKDLQYFHEEMQHHMIRQGLSCSIVNEATVEGNKSIKELKRGSARKELEEIKKATKSLAEAKDELWKNCEEITDELFAKKEELQKIPEQIQKELERLEEVKGQVASAEGTLSEKNSAIENLQEAYEALETNSRTLLTKWQSYKEQVDDLEQTKEKLEGRIATIDSVTSYLSSNDREKIHMQNHSFEEKSGLFSKIEHAGTFVEGLNPKQLKAIIERGYANEALEKSVEKASSKAKTIVKEAKAQAQEIIDSATDKKNETVAAAQAILNNQQALNDQAERKKREIKELEEQYKNVYQEVQKVLQSREQVEPLRREVAELQEVKDILSGKLRDEYTKAAFKDWDEMPYGADMHAYRKRGELLAVYNDGSIRKVEANANGGLDYKTLEDNRNGLCRIGIMQEERSVKVPESLFKELIQKQDKTKALSQNLTNLIRQETKVHSVSQHRER